jgi:hypothetical protein
MNKIEEIFKSWNISFNPTEQQNELASKRIEICNSCEYKVSNLGINRCSVCGCSLKGKIFSPVKGACPEKKWDNVDAQFGITKLQRNLRFVCAQPASNYYVWQVEVMLNNFMEMGINLNNVDIVCWKTDGIVPENWSKLANNYPARFFFYNDTRKTKNYISSIRPNILKQHFKEHPYLNDDAIFYHDCDILFTKPIKQWITSEMITDDKWYGSDTRWYIAHSYIKSKGEDILNKMCEIVNIDPKVVEDNELNTIGAQYLMKGISSDFWENVEIHSEKLFTEITEMNTEKIQLDRRTMPPGEERTPYHPIQIWCADMWAVLWNGWNMGYETIVHENFNFSWGTSKKDEFFENNIFHNAGVVSDSTNKFYKAKFINKLPYDSDETVDENTASYQYYKLVKQVGKKSVLL